ncbi:CDP-glucose 4,6-dehydratase [Candidatus Woesearchaeota archaeon]|nr:MAG: CDP-glucose 4,6-dehydratase [Candidatus Woesearchaeota archaeon]
MVDKKFWKGKRVLVTGHTGFKGCWLTLWLHKLGAIVTGFSLEEYPNDRMFRECGLSRMINDERGDIRNMGRLSEVFQKYKPEIVFHLAAQPLVRLSYEKPVETLSTNIQGTVNVLQCIKDSNYTKAAVIITSDKCYRNNEWVWGYREIDALGGFDPYSCSKACVELVVECYRNSFFKQAAKNVATARAGNVIGGGDWAKDRIIPDCVKAITAGRPIEIRNPHATRPWQHVLEPTSGYLMLGQKLFESNGYDSAWNFGPYPQSIITVREMVEIFLRKWGKGEWRDVSNTIQQPHEAKLLALDISKARFVLKWTPKLSVEESIEWTVEWYKKHSKESSYKLCIEQIERYEKS